MQLLHHALTAAWLLEKDAKLGPAWRFDTRRIHFRLADKLNAPNSAATFAALKSDLTAFFTKLLGTPDFSLEHYSDARVPFEVRLTTTNFQPVETLLARVQD